MTESITEQKLYAELREIRGAIEAAPLPGSTTSSRAMREYSIEEDTEQLRSLACGRQ